MCFVDTSFVQSCIHHCGHTISTRTYSCACTCQCNACTHIVLSLYMILYTRNLPLSLTLGQPPTHSQSLTNLTLAKPWPSTYPNLTRVKEMHVCNARLAMVRSKEHRCWRSSDWRVGMVRPPKLPNCGARTLFASERLIHTSKHRSHCPHAHGTWTRHLGCTA